MIPCLRMQNLLKKYLSQEYDKIRLYKTQQQEINHQSGDAIPQQHIPATSNIWLLKKYRFRWIKTKFYPENCKKNFANRVMDSLISIFLANEFVVSWIYDRNLTATFVSFLVICGFVVIWEIFKFFPPHFKVNSHSASWRDFSEYCNLLPVEMNKRKVISLESEADAAVHEIYR